MLSVRVPIISVIAGVCLTSAAVWNATASAGEYRLEVLQGALMGHVARSDIRLSGINRHSDTVHFFIETNVDPTYYYFDSSGGRFGDGVDANELLFTPSSDGTSSAKTVDSSRWSAQQYGPTFFTEDFDFASYAMIGDWISDNEFMLTIDLYLRSPFGLESSGLCRKHYRGKPKFDYAICGLGYENLPWGSGGPILPFNYQPYVSVELSITGPGTASSSLTSMDLNIPVLEPVPTFIPEPTTWTLFIGGFGLVGCSLRRAGRVTA